MISPLTVRTSLLVTFPLTVGLLLGSLLAPAQALPPRDGLCEALSGDDLTRCLYAELDDRLRAQQGTAPSVSPTPSAGVTSSPPSPSSPTTQPPAAGDWLSGAAGAEAANGSFGSWRGAPVEIGQTWEADPALWTLGPRISGCAGCGIWHTWHGPMSVSLEPRPFTTWAAEASGANDAYWAQIGQSLKRFRQGRGTTYANPYYEFNGDWMRWSVRGGDRAHFRTAYARTSAILRREFPEVRMVLNPDAGRTMPADMWPASGSFDVVGIDSYNEWPHCKVAACVRSTFLDPIEDYRLAAAERGKPIAFPEWGNSSSSRAQGGGGEAPALMDAFHAYLSQHGGAGPGRVVYETYFNIGGYAQRFELYLNGGVNPMQPQTADRYRTRF